MEAYHSDESGVSVVPPGRRTSLVSSAVVHGYFDDPTATRRLQTNLRVPHGPVAVL
jgi:hypothetical protein